MAKLVISWSNEDLEEFGSFTEVQAQEIFNAANDVMIEQGWDILSILYDNIVGGKGNEHQGAC